MKITYTNNPLTSIIEVDEDDIKRIKQSLEVEELWGVVYRAQYHLETIKNYNPVKAEAILEDAHREVYKEIDRCLPYYLESLSGRHGGDCTSFACSCEKCQTERMLGIDTIEGLSKGMGSAISGLFKFESDLSIHEAISNYEETIKIPIEKKTGKDEWLNAHIPRWENDRTKTLEWLKKYRDAHFPL